MLLKIVSWRWERLRGPVVAAPASIARLSGRCIAGAAVRVADPDSRLVDHPFRVRDNLGRWRLSVTKGHNMFSRGESVENILAWIARKPTRTLTAAQREIDCQSGKA